MDDRLYPHLVPTVLFELSRASSSQLSVISRALEKIPEPDKKDVLNNALNDAIKNNIGGRVFLFADAEGRGGGQWRR